MGSFFSWAQWQELELQALIYRYMLAGAAVPQELLLPIKKSLLHLSPSYFLHHPLQHLPHYQPACESREQSSSIYFLNINGFCATGVGVVFPRSRLSILVYYLVLPILKI